MYQFTTDQIRIKLPQTIPVGTIDKLVVSMIQGTVKLEKDETEITLDTENNKLIIDLTQAETGAFAVGSIAVQCHFICGSAAFCTNEMYVEVFENIHGEVLE